MKSLIKISLSLVMVFMVFNVSGQSDPTPKNNGWVVSKDVQRYSNKSLSEPTGIQVTSVGTPEYVNSKMRSSQTDAPSGNVKSSGTPAWVVSKSVQLNKK
ncbi:MAG: hypothetical protein JNM78_17175 [Cyclobacteriaceae bacterium]|nr:hypothetical protein [Cyclobacteriaceae bacterium]